MPTFKHTFYFGITATPDREIENGYKASLRSNNYVNVSDVCIAFNGGGHIRAAGCNIYGTLEECKNKIIQEVEKYIK